MRPSRLLLTIALLTLAAPAAASAQEDGQIGPDRSITTNGRFLQPAGRLTTLGNFPTGGALTPDGRFYWAVDAGHGRNDVKVVDVASGDVIQTLALPGGYVGVDFAPDGRTAYVSGSARASPTREGRSRGRAGM